MLLMHCFSLVFSLLQLLFQTIRLSVKTIRKTIYYLFLSISFLHNSVVLGKKVRARFISSSQAINCSLVGIPNTALRDARPRDLLTLEISALFLTVGIFLFYQIATNLSHNKMKTFLSPLFK